jgi:phosphotriesterase-related protein
MDRYGLDVYLPTEQRQATVLALLEKGHADRMFLSQDFCSTIDYFTPEVYEQLKQPQLIANWSMTFLFEQVIPELKERGMSDEQLDQMMVENPKAWLAGG